VKLSRLLTFNFVTLSLPGSENHTMVSLVVNFLLFLFQEQHTRTKVNGFCSVQLFYKRHALALSQLSVGLIKWQIYRVFKVFSEHLEMKKIKIAFRAVVSD